jgi:hypothetical protein
MGIHSRRIIDFLLAEHLRQGCRRNGLLKAPWHQLCAFGIGRRLISAAIVDLEDSGLVMCARPGHRTASTYRITWLPTPDGRPATNEWREVRAINEWKVGAAKAVRSRKGAPGLLHEGEADEPPNLVPTGVPDEPPNLVPHGELHTLRKKEPSDRNSPTVPLTCPPSTPLSDGNPFSDRLGSDPARAGGNGTAVAGRLRWSTLTYVEIALKPWAGAE